MNLRRRRSGYALIIVISVLALLALYVAAVQGSLRVTISERKLQQDRLWRAQCAAAALSLVAGGEVPVYAADEAGTATLSGLAPAAAEAHQEFEVRFNPEDSKSSPLTSRVTRRTLAPEDSLWQRMPGLRPEPGDALVTIAFRQGDAIQSEKQFLVNTQSRRRGAISLGRLLKEP
jgi:Tfp pilus assembly protein PilX